MQSGSLRRTWRKQELKLPNSSFELVRTDRAGIRCLEEEAYGAIWNYLAPARPCRGRLPNDSSRAGNRRRRRGREAQCAGCAGGARYSFWHELRADRETRIAKRSQHFYHAKSARRPATR